MPVKWPTEVEQERLNSFPAEIQPGDVIAFFTLTDADLKLVKQHHGEANRLGFALQLCALRYLGFIPDDLKGAPNSAVGFLARQLSASAEAITGYGKRGHTQSDHALEIQSHLGFRRVTDDEWIEIEKWLTARAMEHDRPLLLLSMLCERLHATKLVRPGITLLERAVSAARGRAQDELWRLIAPLLNQTDKAGLDRLLVIAENSSVTPLTQYRTGAVSYSASSILKVLEKIVELRALGVERWDVSRINPNRLKRLAQIGGKATNQILERMQPERRYPILLAFLHQALTKTIDEAIDLFDRSLADCYSRAGRELEEFRRGVAKATNEKVRLFRTVGRILLDPDVKDSEIRALIYQQIAPDDLRYAVDECEQIMRPLDDSYFDLLATRYSTLRQFAPRFLETFTWQSAQEDDALLGAIGVLKELNASGTRKIPANAPREFIPDKWEPYVIDENGQASRRYYELCLLWEMRGALRAGNLWVEGSRRYTNPESYLIPSERWAELRTETCLLINAPEDGAVRFTQRAQEMEQAAAHLALQLRGQDKVRIENGELIVSPLEAEERPAGSVELEELVVERLPRIDLPALLIEVDGWVNYTQAFTHAGGSQTRKPDLLPTIYASLLAQSGNFGLTQMTRMSDIGYQQLLWTTNWYLREETLKAATTRLVNYHHHLPLSRLLGGGTISSSDGQRFPVAVKTANATALPKYFGYGRGLTFYTWTSDQYSQFGTKVIPATMRDATVVLDEILDNETELPLFTHSTDTAGYTEIVFGLFDLLGLQFAPRIRDLGDQCLYRLKEGKDHGLVNDLLTGKLNPQLFLKQWDDLLRVAGSLKLGWVTASLLISKLHAMPKQNTLVKSLQEYGRLIKTHFILRYLGSEDFRRQINLQLNKGEALHSLRRYLFVANEAQIRKRHPEDQLNQAACLNLVTNAVVAWNTVYMWEAIEQLKKEGRQIDDADVKHLSPARYEHINVFGKYSFPVKEELSRKSLRPLRAAGRDAWEG
jgi:TnpA family transposase